MNEGDIFHKKSVSLSKRILSEIVCTEHLRLSLERSWKPRNEDNVTRIYT